MAITDPSALHPAWAAAFNDKDVAAMTALGEDGYLFVPQPGAVTSGADAEGALQQFLAMGLPIQPDRASRAHQG